MSARAGAKFARLDEVAGHEKVGMHPTGWRVSPPPACRSRSSWSRSTLLQDDDENMVPGLMDDIWQLDHPRLADVLEAIGAHHPAKPVSKAARKALMKHRNR